MRSAVPTIAVIGAGFSGSTVALHLLQHAPTHRILLCERGPTFARGAAYGTDDPEHLLNVRASNMSAFPDRPGDFEDWLEAHGPDTLVVTTEAGRFVSRAVYGRYLSSLLEAALAHQAGATRLRIVPDEVCRVTARTPGRGYRIELASGQRHDVVGIVLAVGNLPAGGSCPQRCIRDPWTQPFTQDLEPGRPVVVLGTGLTAIDVVASLKRSGFDGPIRLMSRRGLLPRGHAPAPPRRFAGEQPGAEWPLSASLRWLRSEIRDAARDGLPWQSVVDALRPSTSRLWQEFGPERQNRFLRHLRPWWDVHRHRTPPTVSRQLEAWIASGMLQVSAGHLVEVGPEADRVLVAWRPRGTAETRTIEAQRLIYATGSSTVDASRDPLLQGLVEDGLVRVDRHGFGVEADASFRLVGRDGCPAQGLWGLGPIVRGTFWECTAVPDIRSDAVRVATAIGKALAA